MLNSQLKHLQKTLASIPDLELAVLVGSRASGKVAIDSDWDFAIQWSRSLDGMSTLGRMETLRRQIAEHLGVTAAAIDMIDIPVARLAMRAVIAEEGIILKGKDSLYWNRFLQRTWRELEEYYWEQTYAD